MDSTPEQPVPEKKFSLDILAKTRIAQLANGLRHGDYNRYKNYCTRRIRRIHKKVKFYDKPQQGPKQHHFRPKVVTPTLVTDVRFLELVLVMAERSWAHAMALRDVVEPRAKFHSTRRFTKAAKWALHLTKLCAAKSDQRTSLEALGYYSWLTANIFFQKENWKSAHENFVKANAIYKELAKTSEPQYQDYFKDRETEIEPSIRYCLFNLKGQTLPDDSAILDPLKPQFEAVLAEAATKPPRQLTSKELNALKQKQQKKSDKARPTPVQTKPVEPTPAPVAPPPVVEEPKAITPLPPLVVGKPLLFDLALSQCAFPDLTERKKAPKGGFFSSWWG